MNLSSGGMPSSVEAKIRETTAKLNLKTETINSLVSIINTAIVQGSDIMKALIQAGMSNSFVGIVAMCIAADILQKAGLIFASTNVLIKGMALAAFGINAAGVGVELITDVITSLDPITGLFQGNKPIAEPLLTPSLNILVVGDSNQDLAPMLKSLASRQLPSP